jgi:Uma2 family endonuclease
MVVSSFTCCLAAPGNGIVARARRECKGALSMTTTAALLTAEDYFQLPDTGQPTELVRGRVVTMNLPTPRHGQICLKVGRLLGNYAEDHDLGHVVSNDSGILTDREPDTVRGGDLAFYSYAKVPKGPLPQGYLNAVPELVVEVRSRTDLWKKVIAKVAEYLQAGVLTVCVLDEQTCTAQLFFAEELPRTLTDSDELTFGEIVPGFRVVVGRLFE